MFELAGREKKEIQGFVFSGFGHLNVHAFLFFEIVNADRGREFLAGLLPKVTTAEDWRKRSDGTKEKPDVTLNVAVDYEGLGALAVSDDIRLTFSREFIMGMAQRSGVIGDSGASAPENWEIGGPDNPPLHLLLLIYAIDESAKQSQLDWIQELVDRSDGGVRQTLQQGGVRYTNREPFGFHDGIGQPGIEGIDGEPSTSVIRLGEFVLGHHNEYQILPPTAGVPIAKDPLDLLPPFPTLPSYKDLGRNGTYLVYRKLAQDVAGFWRYVEANAGAPPDGSEEERHRAAATLAAKFVGRWPSGAPLVLSSDHDDPRLANADDFSYQLSDPHGYACPIGAHIRRSNPRDALMGDTREESFLTSNRHRIIRRSILFGPSAVDEEMMSGGRVPLGLDQDQEERGIHFFCLNTNISNQFEFIQQTWVNNGRFNGLLDDRDPLIGSNDGPTTMTIPTPPLRRRVHGLPRFVTVRGGGYFFLPSLTALRFVSGPR